jgi:MFS family permease
VTFTESAERAKAFAVYGAIAGGGAAVGLIAGGVLTEYASWRWCLLVNVPIALLAAAAALAIVRESRNEGDAHYDIPGAVLVTAGLASLVYGFTKAAADGWSSPVTLGFIAAAVALLAAFVVVEMRSAAPLLPLRVPLERNRGGSYFATLMVGAGLFAMFLFLTYYFQIVLGYSALRSGFAFLPFSAGIIATAGVVSQVLPRTGPKPLMLLGSAMGVLGMLYLTQITPTTTWVLHVLPAEVLLSVGMGLLFVPLSSTALLGVQPHDAGVASALLNTSQQVGGSLGTALLNTVAATATAGYLTGHHVGLVHTARGNFPPALAAVHGYTTAFTAGAGMLAIAFVAIALLLQSPRTSEPANPAADTIEAAR